MAAAVALPALRPASRPVTWGFVVVPLVALAVAVTIPGPASVLSLAVAGVAHLGFEARYVSGRFGPRVGWSTLGWLAAAITVIAATRLAIGATPTTLRLEATIALGLVAFVVRRRLALVAVVALAIAAAWQWPDGYRVAVTHLHNLVPVALLWELSGDLPVDERRRFRRLQLVWAVAIPAVVLSGALDGLLPSAVPSSLVHAYAPGGASTTWAARFVAVFAYGQLVHYAIWCGFIPAATAAETKAARHLPPFRPVPFAIALVAVAGVVGALLLADTATGRPIYSALAAYHAYLEYPILALLAVRRPHELEKTR